MFNSPEIDLILNPELNQLRIISDQIFIACNIYSGIGQRVLSTKLTSDVIDVSGFPGGLCIIELQRRGMVVQKKIVLQ